MWPAPARVSAPCLRAYARDRLAAAAAYPKERLRRRDFRLAQANVTVWFASEDLAGLCERTLIQRTVDTGCPDPVRLGRVTIYAMDAEADGWDPPAEWDEAAGFSSREFA